MGKGKKKGDRKTSTDDVESALAQSSITEGLSSTAEESQSVASSSTQSVASTSTPAQPVKEEPEITGLGVKGYKKKRPPRKKKPAQEEGLEAAAASVPSTPSEPPQVPTAAPLPASVSYPSFPGFGATSTPHSEKPIERGYGRGAGDVAGLSFPPLQASQGPPPSRWGAPQKIQQGPPLRPQLPQYMATPQGQNRPMAPQGQHRPMTPQGQHQPIQSQAQHYPSQQHPKYGQALPPQTSVDQPKPRSAQYKQELSRFVVPHKKKGNTVRAMQIRVITNYLPMEIKSMKIYRYDVSIDPQKPKKLIPEVFKRITSKHFPNMCLAFDQVKNFYSTKPLPNITDRTKFTSGVEITDDNGRVLSFNVSIQSTGVVDTNALFNYMNSGGTSLNTPAEAIQCLDVVLRQGTLQAYIKCSHNFFKRPPNPIDLGEGLEMWTGLFQSAIFTSKPFINIDVAHKGFARASPMIDVLRVFDIPTNQTINVQRVPPKFRHFLKGLRVVVSIMSDGPTKKREYICNEVVDSARNLKFRSKNPVTGRETEMSVADYFLKEKGFRLRYPDLNCLWVGPRDKTIYYPMELVSVAYGQVLNKQLTESQLGKMVREAATPPSERLKKIKEVMGNMNYASNQYFQEFGLKITETFTNVNAKVISPPQLSYGGRMNITPRSGKWDDRKMLQSVTVHLWGLIAVELDQRRSNSETLILELKNSARDMGISMGDPSFQMYNVQTKDLERTLDDAARNNLQLLFVIIPKFGRDTYSQVKKIAEKRVGILTQCIKEATAQRINNRTTHNILLKLNSKLMGINQSLHENSLPRCIMSGDVMVVGADVTHPSPDQISIPSIAAVTASIDKRLYQYNIALSIQTPKKEMIVQFEDMMAEHLSVYKSKHNAVPRKIYVFRDGVSEGQFAQVMHCELAAIYKAYERFSTTKPEVLFLLVQKRHHTRFFAQQDSRIENVLPGTVVDTDIVHASELDFYLVSHAAIKGTARPTRYHAICNDGSLPDDEVEQLAYYLCHLYSRCARSVSYPTPTYYAHLACLRARVLTKDEKFNNAALETEPRRLRILDKINKPFPMFFV